MRRLRLGFSRLLKPRFPRSTHRVVDASRLPYLDNTHTAAVRLYTLPPFSAAHVTLESQRDQANSPSEHALGGVNEVNALIGYGLLSADKTRPQTRMQP